MSETRVRFAPSPTGHLHIGSVRTAVYNWLLARQKKGTFVLRIEDTDRERSTEESVQAILESMRWLGLDWDEGPEVEGPNGPYFQTQRFDIYREYIDKMLAEGKAYRCYATAEELTTLREQARERGETFKYDRRWRDKGPDDWPEDKPYSVRFKAPLDGEVVVEDLIKGRVVFDVAQHIDDFIIMRSDGTPTYNFTVVVDDVTMNITDVIRGDDHLNNTPKQLLLYEALDFPVPRFAHMPLTLGQDKTRLSKRHGATSVMAYREMGYLPHALLNFLLRLGWSHGDQEIFSVEEMIRLFSVEKIGISAGIFNAEKLAWVNQQYIMNDPPESIAKELPYYLDKLGIQATVDERLVGIVKELSKRAKTLVEMAEGARMFFKDDFEYVEKADRKFLKKESLPVLEFLRDGLRELDAFSVADVQGVFEAAMERFELKLGKVAQPMRVALTGNTVSPGIYETVYLMGREPVLARLERAIAHINAKPAE